MASAQSMNQKFINKLNELLETNLENEHFGVKELAKAMGVSRSQLHRKVHAVNNSSTSQFIREFRLKKAMAMLQNNVATASEIAYRVGFSSPTYFNTCFRDHYGFPPGEVKHRKKVNVGVVDLRSSDEVGSKQNPITTTSFGKGLLNKRSGLIFSVVLLAILAIAYTYFSIPKNTAVIEEVGNFAQDNSIAVLPFKNWSGDPELEYISDGMTDAVISRLTKIQAIENVIPFTSMLKYKDTDKSIPQIAKELEVRHILQGNFQLSGTRLKINIQLIDGPANYHFWSDGYEGEWETNDIFNVQAEVAENVAKNMNVEIKKDEFEAINTSPSQNKEAYNLWLQANYQERKRTKIGMENAALLCEKAISLDSTFMKAYVRLAYLNLWGGANWGIYKEEEAWDKAKELAQKMKQMDSANPRIKRVLLDGSYIYEWNFDQMEDEYLNSSLAIPYALQTGRYEETLKLINHAIYANPTIGFMHAWKAQALYFLNRKEDAINHLKTNNTLFNDHIDYLREAAKCYFYLEEYESSKAHLVKLMTNFSDRPPTILWLLAVHAQREGDTKGLNAYLEALQIKYEAGESGSPAWFLGLYYATIGEYDVAFEWLQKSFDRHEGEMIWLREEPTLIPLRNDERYLQLYAKVGFPMEPHSTPE